MSITLETGTHTTLPHHTNWFSQAVEGTTLLGYDGLAWQKGQGIWWAAGSNVPRTSFDMTGEGPFTILSGGTV
ncbi:hypothetical protein JOJ86_006024 [Rhodococcus percolatus]|uniref:hypothetical protein n=1 Tax=Rhodococcus opacus TaxID=37919 RepID=UPI0015F94724|nr:hypothetical protein [Rhodococcus opacus]MBA8964746.1 hypothetical protein [Rhodococcus opacus]MBP2208298.1 hypothetical protein [Rhodococcus opacus]